MNHLLLAAGARLLLPVLLVLSVVILYRGHNLPGGGFIGGLTAAAAFAILALGEGRNTALHLLRVAPSTLMTAGLAVAFASGLAGPIAGRPFLAAVWLPEFTLPLLGTVHLGTPLVFDIGVYLTVVGFTLSTVFALASPAETPTRPERPALLTPEGPGEGSQS
ncbi:MAG: MnhB domain-containing protein [Candidatus Krumholzibacteriia bacterium]